ncbi:MAG TPA: hypothetical protein VE980_01155 [Pyrinomonadaceae bacterium]|nr:hypothetical protein [Pyrinomonadaceae bacterium]
MTGLRNKLTAGVILASVIVGPACRTARPAESIPANRSNSNVSGTTASVPQTESKCDPNYSPCVPIASDVDCAGGRGNGPAFVKGPVKVIGKDIYKLDGDHNGIGCE